MKWLAVDYGDSRTGLAGCDAGETITSPITPQIEEKSMNKVAAAVTEVFAARGAEGLVCGLPKNMDGTEGSRANKSRRFAQRLATPRVCPLCCGMSAAPPCPPPLSWPTTIRLVPSARSGWTRCPLPSFWRAF